MSGVVCSKCGKPIYPGGSFCGFCATPVPALSAPVAEASSAASGAIAASSGLESISRALGLGSVANFVLRQEGSANLPRFAFTDPSHRALFWLQPATPHPRLAVRLGRGRKLDGGITLGAAGQTRPWALLDARGLPVGTLVLQHAAAAGHATLYDASEGDVLNAQTESEGWGGYRLTSTLADGTPYLQSVGKIRGGEQEFRDGVGSPVARVHFPKLSAHDRLYVDLVGGADPLGPLILAFFVHHLEP